MKKFIIFLLFLFAMTGCSVNTTKNSTPKPQTEEINQVKVIEKEEKTYFRASSDYFVTVEKNDSKATFEVNENIFNMVEEGSIISGEYNQEGIMTKVTFDNFK